MAREENGFCLPLVQGTTSVGLLHLHFPAQTTIKREQISLLENTSYEMASSLSLLMEKKGNEEAIFAQKINQIQLEIARDLHDTIGQNIGYLRMQLDHMAEKEQQNFQKASVELNQLLDVANESYDLIRGTLAVLQTGGSDDILPLFTRYAEKVMERTGITISIQNRGDAGCLNSNSMRQLYFIFREALSNIEKHAQATQVKVELIWHEDHLQLVITDNGAGFTNDGIAKGRYGIKFMRGRIDSLQGSLSIQTAPGVGTSLSIQVPCDC
jgi:signal transduction histidine kinase